MAEEQKPVMGGRGQEGKKSSSEGVTARLQRLMSNIGAQQEEILERYQLRIEATLARHSEDLKGSVRELLGGDAGQHVQRPAAEERELLTPRAALAARPALPEKRFSAGQNPAAFGAMVKSCCSVMQDPMALPEDLGMYIGRIRRIADLPVTPRKLSELKLNGHSPAAETEQEEVIEGEEKDPEIVPTPTSSPPKTKRATTFGQKLKGAMKRSATAVLPFANFSDDDGSDGPKLSSMSKRAQDESFADAMLRLRTSNDTREHDEMSEWQMDTLRRQQPPEPRYRLNLVRLRQIVHGNLMQSTVCGAIVLNAMFIGIQADSSIKVAIDNFDRIVLGKIGDIMPPEWFYIVDISFLGFFTAELVMRVLAEETQFLFGPEKKWNMFDSFLVISALLEELLRSFDLSFFRLLRMLRTVRAIRVVRVVRSFRELRLMLIAVWGSMLPVLWAFVFLCVIMFLASVILMQAVTNKVSDISARPDIMDMGACGDEDVRPGVSIGICSEMGMIDTTKEYFNSLTYMVLSLFMSISGGMDWWEFGKPLMEISPFYGLFFVMYVAFMTFGVLNIITGIFCEAAAEIANSDRDLVVGAEIEKQKSYIKSLKELFCELDQDHSGQITYQEFQEALKEDKVQAFFITLGINASEALMVFKLLDSDNSGSLTVEEFCIGCMRVRGNATTLDMTGLMFENKRRLEEMEKRHEGILKALGLVLRACEQAQEPDSPKPAYVDEVPNDASRPRTELT